MTIKIAPLSGSFLLVGMFGFLFGLFVILPSSLNFGVLIVIFSFIMIVASMISTTYGPVEEELSLDEHHTDRKKRVYTLTKKEFEEWKAHKKKETASATKQGSNKKKKK